MEARHASLVRRTLEEIRQKRAAERLNRTSSGPYLTKAPIANDNIGTKISESTNRLSEVGHFLLGAAVEGIFLNTIEQNTLPSLTKALKDVALEKDAAVVAREDLSTQLRTLKKRLRENSTRTMQS
ncbi:uncharacterized protein LOC110612917 [Manihot esculenta]|uniref:Uncharacterized protein n=1 Tax=Manihot esculenta TaxID=3983 RepID=A0ACB7HSN9_MANES|nr:uncharacterized protein LOC110612917 [Manihot esculenta]KAG8655804.1 hypothetical protein MANES_04G070850v8 [Manihot esculenta]